MPGQRGSALITEPARPFGADRTRRVAEIEGRHFWFAARRRLVERRVRAHLGVPGATVVDLGCGTAATLSMLRAAGHAGVGMDLSGEAVSIARARDADALLVRGSVATVPLRDGCADGVLLLDVLEHVDEEPALSEARRLLRRGGVAILTVPAFRFLWSSRDDEAGHLRRYDRRSLRAAIERSGLQVVDLRFFGWLWFPALLMSRLAGRRRPRWQQREERLGRGLNALFGGIGRVDAAVGETLRIPWGSSLIAVARCD